MSCVLCGCLVLPFAWGGHYLLRTTSPHISSCETWRVFWLTDAHCFALCRHFDNYCCVSTVIVLAWRWRASRVPRLPCCPSCCVSSRAITIDGKRATFFFSLLSSLNAHTRPHEITILCVSGGGGGAPPGLEFKGWVFLAVFAEIQF